MRELSEEFGEDALEVGVPVNSMAKFLWYGLKHEDPDLKIEDVEDMVDLEHLDDVMKAVFLATGRRAEKVPGPQMPAPQIPRPAVAGSEKKPSVSQSVSPSVIPESAQTERA
jgi:hypothetical protein